MQKLLITGATGNVGLEVIKALHQAGYIPGMEVIAGVRDVEKDRAKLAQYQLTLRQFDFTDPATFQTALSGCEILFLLRPPQISQVEKYFRPLIEAAQEKGVKHIIFLSVQGVENSRIIPHHKIEKLISESRIAYTFLRPAYFMQNFTSTLHQELVTHRRIFLPAGKAKFTLIDVRDVGKATAAILKNLPLHVNSAYELTNDEKLTFGEMAAILSEELGISIRYESPNLLRFITAKRKDNIPMGYILVMIMLHYLPRFQKEPPVTDRIAELTGDKPITFRQFVRDHKRDLIGQ